MSHRCRSIVLAPLVAALLISGAAAGQPADPPQPPLPPANSKGFVATSPEKTPGQLLVPPPQAAKGDVIAPPTAVDPGIAKPTPPPQAFPTPVIKPAPPPSR